MEQKLSATPFCKKKEQIKSPPIRVRFCLEIAVDLMTHAPDALGHDHEMFLHHCSRAELLEALSKTRPVKFCAAIPMSASTPWTVWRAHSVLAVCVSFAHRDRAYATGRLQHGTACVQTTPLS
jgi:hypothetical protein